MTPTGEFARSSLLKYLLGPHTLTTTVYDWALQQFRERHEELVFQSSRDQWFLTKFLYRLDVEFDTMSANLIKSWDSDKVRPFAQAIEDRIVYKAQQKLERKCEGFLTEMKGCRLPLPLALTNPVIFAPSVRTRRGRRGVEWPTGIAGKWRGLWRTLAPERG